MCGIVGMVSAYSNGFDLDEANCFKDMLVIDTLRGFDSTGVFSVSNVGNVDILKSAINGASFVRTKEYNAFEMNLWSTGIFAVGHNRYATRGSVTDENAHPFYPNDKIVLVQNGSYRGDHKHLADTNVDSEAIAHVLCETKDIEKALQRVNASYALVWYDVEDKILNIIRNEERPMHIGYAESGAVLFASELGTILAAAARNNITFKESPYLIEANGLVQYYLDANTKKYTSEFMANMKINYDHTTGPKTYTQENWKYYNNYRGSPFYEALNEDEYNQDNRCDIGTPIHVWVNRGKFDDWWMDKNIAKTIEQHYQGKSRGETTLVEFLDYVPLNNNKDCRVWAAYGKLLTANYDGNSPVFYCMFWDKDEEEVMQFCAKEFYNVHTSTPMVTHAMNEYLMPGAIITIFCTEPEYADLFDTKTVENVQ